MTRIIFFGTPEFAIQSLEVVYSLQPAYGLAAVITKQDKPAGRGRKVQENPVKQWAEARGVLVLQPERIRDHEWTEKIRQLKPDLGVIAAYGQIIPKELLDIPKYGVLNIHPSLLPRWRGPSPIQTAILAGDRETGVTIMLTDEEMDHGPILTQEKTEIEKLETGETLTKKLAELGAKLLKETVPEWIAGEIKPQQQDHIKATYSKILRREDGRIDWDKPADELERQIRAFLPWPGSFTEWQDARGHHRLKILAVRVIENAGEFKPGIAFEYDNSLAIYCQAKTAAILERIQPEGKQPISGTDFLRGHKDVISTRFG